MADESGGTLSTQTKVSIGLTVAILTLLGGFFAKSYLRLDDRDAQLDEELHEVEKEVLDAIGRMDVWITHRDETWDLHERVASSLYDRVEEDVVRLRSRIDFLERRVDDIEAGRVEGDASGTGNKGLDAEK